MLNEIKTVTSTSSDGDSKPCAPLTGSLTSVPSTSPDSSTGYGPSSNRPITFHDSPVLSCYNISKAYLSKIRQRSTDSLILRSPRTFDTYNSVAATSMLSFGQKVTDCDTVLNLLQEQRDIVDEQIQNILSGAILDMSFLRHLERIMRIHSRNTHLRKGITSPKIHSGVEHDTNRLKAIFERFMGPPCRCGD